MRRAVSLALIGLLALGGAAAAAGGGSSHRTRALLQQSNSPSSESEANAAYWPARSLYPLSLSPHPSPTYVRWRLTCMARRPDPAI